METSHSHIDETFIECLLFSKHYQYKLEDTTQYNPKKVEL